MKLKSIVTVVAFAGLSVSNVWAAGFEKSVQWSAKYVGRAGAVASNVKGSESLYFNPAGLVEGEGNQLTLSISPTFSQFKAPITTADVVVDGEKNTSVLPALTYSYKINEKWAFGAGYYVAAGTKASFSDIVIPAASSQEYFPDMVSDIKALELGIGGAYKIDDNWSVGLTWRYTSVTAEYKLFGVSWPYLSAVEYTDLKDDNFSAFRMGAKYLSTSLPLGVGLNIRTGVDFEAKGSATRYTDKLDDSAAILSSKADVTLKSSLPTQISLDGFYGFSDHWTGYFGLTHTAYGSNKKVGVDGTVTLNGDVTLEWKDQINYRLAAEYSGVENWQFRGGYVMTTQVTPNDYASPTFASPGPGHTIVFGAGSSAYNGALEYSFSYERSWAEGNVTPITPRAKGKYSSLGDTIHMTISYNF